MKKFLIVLSIFCTHHSKAQDTAKTDSKLISATVYFGYGAELTHEAKLHVNTGIKQIVINRLSTMIDINSLQIRVPENVALLSQRFTVFSPVAPVLINPLVKKLQDSVALVQKELKRNQNAIDIEEMTLDKTGRLIEITITNSGNKTISADDALKLINSYTAKIEKAKAAIFNLAEARTVLNEKIALLSARISEASQQSQSKPAKPYGQLVLQVICNASEDIPVSFSYFTNNAGWTPLYDIRVNSKTNDIKLLYKASVTQTTGIDWKQTKLTLSTGNPSWGGVAPVLDPWYLQLYVPVLYDQFKDAQATTSIANEAMREVIVTDANGTAKKKYLASEMTIDPSNLQKYTTLTESQLNSNFEIDLPYDIESNGQVHSVTIKEEKIIATLKNHAIPKADRDAWLMAEVSDWETLNLLPGTANIIMDDTYLGKSFIDPNSTADTLNLSLGKDRRVAVKRNIVKEFTSTKTSANTTRQTFTYEITLKNNKSTDVDIQLKDQYPVSTVKEIEIKLEDRGSAAVDEETGILSWSIRLKPGESKKVRFTYTVKYPKDKKIANL